MHRGDASEKGLICVKRDFSAMCDQTVTKEFRLLQGDITVPKQRHKVYQTESHVSICINRLTIN